MSSVLSTDLRRRVVDSIQSGMGKSEAERVFKVSRSSIYRWLKLHELDSKLQPKTGYQKGHSNKIKNLSEFQEFADKNKYCTLEKMCGLWAEITGISISIPVMAKHLNRIGYTSKKKHFSIVKRIKKNALHISKN